MEFSEMITEVYKNGKLENTLKTTDKEEILKSLLEDFSQAHFYKVCKIELAGYNENGYRNICSIYKNEINEAKYKTKRLYIRIR